MKPVYVASCNIVSPLGFTAEENFTLLRKEISGVHKHERDDIDEALVFASLIEDDKLDSELKGESSIDNFSRFEKLIIASVRQALNEMQGELKMEETLFVISSTKGNISLLEEEANQEHIDDAVSMSLSAEKIAAHFGSAVKPVVISNACISGVVALLYARRMFDQGDFKNIIVTGADCINHFIHSGFLSFQALSPGVCRPFSASREGINLGEGAATIILTTEKNLTGDSPVQLMQGAITNDANHISGPSRTGEELAFAIEKAIDLSGVEKSQIDFISAHGTATPFNDEMEAKAITLSGLQNTPVNSLKAYFGHTLGAAGLVESVIGILSLQQGEMIASAGFTAPSVEPPVHVIEHPVKKTSMKHFLKTASGFGGCNAALIFSKS